MRERAQNGKKKCDCLNCNNDSCYRLSTKVDKRSLTESENSGVDWGDCAKRKRRRMNFSTPQNRQKEATLESPTWSEIKGITPIQAGAHSPDLVAPDLFDSSNGGDKSCPDKGKTNLSNELRGKVIAPRKIETEEEENCSFVKATNMLIRSSVGLNCTDGKCEVPQLVDDLEENHYIKLTKRERAMTLPGKLEDMNLVDITNWSSDPSFSPVDRETTRLDSRLALGTNATAEVLALPATPRTHGGNSKRLFSPCKKTPTGRPRKLSSCLMASPQLRSKVVITVEDKLMTLPSSTAARLDVRGEFNSIPDRKNGGTAFPTRMDARGEFNYGGTISPTRMGARGEFNYDGTTSSTRMGARGNFNYDKESGGGVYSLNMGNEGDSNYFTEREENIKDQNVGNEGLNTQYAISSKSIKGKGVGIESAKKGDGLNGFGHNIPKTPDGTKRKRRYKKRGEERSMSQQGLITGMLTPARGNKNGRNGQNENKE